MVPTDIGNIPPSTGGGGGGGGSFGSDVIVTLPNGSSVSVPAAELITAVSGVTGSEASSFLIKLYRAGAQINSLKIDTETGLTIVVDKLSPAAMLILNASNAGSTSNGIRIQTQGADRAIISCDVSGHVVFQTDGFFDVSNLAGTVHYFRVQPGLILCLGARVERARGAGVASATTLTLGTDGNIFPITGATTINGITTANWLSGADLVLELPSGITITHNSGAPGGGAVAIQLKAAANLTTARVTMLPLIYNGTFWYEAG